MTRARVVIELPTGTRLTAFERDLIELARKYGTSVARSSNPRLPLHYDLRQPPVQPGGAA